MTGNATNEMEGEVSTTKELAELISAKKRFDEAERLLQAATEKVEQALVPIKIEHDVPNNRKFIQQGYGTSGPVVAEALGKGDEKHPLYGYALEFMSGYTPEVLEFGDRRFVVVYGRGEQK